MLENQHGPMAMQSRHCPINLMTINEKLFIFIKSLHVPIPFIGIKISVNVLAGNPNYLKLYILGIKKTVFQGCFDVSFHLFFFSL